MANEAQAQTPAPAPAEETPGLDINESEIFESMRDNREPKPVQAKDPVPPNGDDDEEDDEPALEQPSRPGKVPQQALHKERSRRQAAEAELRKLIETNARSDERLQALMAALNARETAEKQRQAPAQEEPDPDKDIFAYVKYQAKRQAEQAEKIQAYERQQQQTQQQSQFAQAVHAHEQEFVKAQPDYYDAVSWYRDGRARELQALGHSPQQIAQTINSDFVNLSSQAFKAQRSPAEMLYRYAQARGYAAKPVEATPENAPVLDMEKSERLTQRKAANASTGQVGGSAGARRISSKELGEMSDAEFGKILNRAGGYSSEAVRKILGG